MNKNKLISIFLLIFIIILSLGIGIFFSYKSMTNIKEGIVTVDNTGSYQNKPDQNLLIDQMQSIYLYMTLLYINDPNKNLYTQYIKNSNPNWYQPYYDNNLLGDITNIDITKILNKDCSFYYTDSNNNSIVYNINNGSDFKNFLNNLKNILTPHSFEQIYYKTIFNDYKSLPDYTELLEIMYVYTFVPTALYEMYIMPYNEIIVKYDDVIKTMNDYNIFHQLYNFADQMNFLKSYNYIIDISGKKIKYVNCKQPNPTTENNVEIQKFIESILNILKDPIAVKSLEESYIKFYNRLCIFVGSSTDKYNYENTIEQENSKDGQNNIELGDLGGDNKNTDNAIPEPEISEIVNYATTMPGTLNYASVNYATTMPGITTSGTTTSGATTSGTTMSGATIPGATMSGATMPGATTSGTTMPGATMPGTTMSGTTMSGATMSGTINYGTTKPVQISATTTKPVQISATTTKPVQISATTTKPIQISAINTFVFKDSNYKILTSLPPTVLEFTKTRNNTIYYILQFNSGSNYTITPVTNLNIDIYDLFAVSNGESGKYSYLGGKGGKYISVFSDTTVGKINKSISNSNSITFDCVDKYNTKATNIIGLNISLSNTDSTSTKGIKNNYTEFYYGSPGGNGSEINSAFGDPGTGGNKLADSGTRISSSSNDGGKGEDNYGGGGGGPAGKTNGTYTTAQGLVGKGGTGSITLVYRFNNTQQVANLN
uniref:Uncharacterized protein n=1 Tax=viral metagenome TaxID=1070528 RepID=A0A6C0HYG1_9ZZZZ